MQKKLALCYCGLANIEEFAIETFLIQSGLSSSSIDLICCFWNFNIDLSKIKFLEKKFKNVYVTFVEPVSPEVHRVNKYLKFPETNVARVLSMLFIRRQLLRTINSLPTKYDAFVFSRPDIFLTREIEIQKLIDDLGKKYHVCIPNAGSYRNGITDTLLVADFFGLGVYLSAFDRLDRILNSRDGYIRPKSLVSLLKEIYWFFNSILNGRFETINHKLPLHPESITRKNLEESRLDVCSFDVGKIIIKRKFMFSVLSPAPLIPSFTLAREMLTESIHDVDLSVHSIFKN